jgi:lysine/ornithine N-monooxygenase
MKFLRDRLKSTLTIVCAVIPLLTAGSYSQEVEVPVSVQFPLLAKIMTFDRNLKSRVGTQIVFGIVYQSNYRTSLEIHDEFVKAMDESEIKDIAGSPLHHISIDLSDEMDLSDALVQHPVDILYVAPLRAYDLKTIMLIARSKQIITMASAPADVESGLAIGISTRGEKPLIVVNLAEAKAEGADFSSSLLKLAKIIQ